MLAVFGFGLRLGILRNHDEYPSLHLDGFDRIRRSVPPSIRSIERRRGRSVFIGSSHAVGIAQGERGRNPVKVVTP